jgi:hypothetical protein
MNDPKQHVAWALRGMPAFAGAGMVTHPGFLLSWSEHLWQCGFRHVDWLASLADENGMINVADLPRQTIKMQEAVRGPRHMFNSATRWVPVDTPDPEPVHLPDIRDLTIQENMAMLDQYRQVGMIKDEQYGPVLAEEE